MLPAMRIYLAFVFLLTQLSVSAQTNFSSQLPPAIAADTVFRVPASFASPGEIYLKEPGSTHSRIYKTFTRSGLVLTAAGTVGYAAYKIADEPLRRFAMNHQNKVAGTISEYVEPLGHPKNMLAVAGGVYASGLVFRNPKMQRTGILIASALTINDFATSNLKDKFQRRRPDISVHNWYFEGPEGGRHNASMPSWHTSTAFTVATSVAIVYKDHTWVPPVAYGMATLVGLSRVYNNKHWTTDVMAGAAVGFLSAKGANFLLKQAEMQLEKRKINIYVMPRVSTQIAGLNMGATF
jgi:membrane-associated phospholipid phosphatase